MTKTKINTGAAVENHRQKDQGNASPKWIEAIQRQVKIGDTVNVKTNKCCSVDEGMSGKSGVWRKGTVIGIFRNFVHVRLQSGVCESVLWADIMNSSMEDDDEEAVYLQCVWKGDLRRSCDHPDTASHHTAYPP